MQITNETHVHCFTTFPNTSKFVKNTRLSVVFSPSFSGFENVVEHGLSFLGELSFKSRMFSMIRFFVLLTASSFYLYEKKEKMPPPTFAPLPYAPPFSLKRKYFLDVGQREGTIDTRKARTQGIRERRTKKRTADRRNKP